MRPAPWVASCRLATVIIFAWLDEFAEGTRRLRVSEGPPHTADAATATAVLQLEAGNEIQARSGALAFSGCSNESERLPLLTEDMPGATKVTDVAKQIKSRVSEVGNSVPLADVAGPCGNWGIKDARLQQVEHVDESTQDFERRLKPPFVSIPGQAADERLTPQQQKGLEGMFDANPADLRDCSLIHMYAEPLEVVDALKMPEAKIIPGYLTGGEEEKEKDDVGEEVLLRPGPIFDDSTYDKDGNKELHVSTEMYARLEGLTNPVQLIPHGVMSLWHSLWKVPIAGFLCMNADKSDSAPVIYSTPTPCVPTSMDAEGNALNPMGDGFEVWIGSTRLAFPNKTAAETICHGFVEEIGRNLEINNWDVETVRAYFLRHHKVKMPEPTMVVSASANLTPAANDSHAPQADAGREMARNGSTPKPNASAGRTPNVSSTVASQNATAGRSPATSSAAPTSDTKAGSVPNGTALLSTGGAAEPDDDVAGMPGDAEDMATEGMDNMVTPMASVDLQSFISLAGQRGAPAGWTKGDKKMLVVIMDWKKGDKTLQPFSKQQKNPVPLYKDKIVPKALEALREMSYGQLKITADIVPEVIHFTHNKNQMTGKLPFPTLYERARDALQGHAKYGKTYTFKNFHLVFVICPQVNPIGTKGVAWVGSRGAVCNGCETVSDSHKVMVMVHELGHNLGLAHASSEALDYGNIFDWMGNSPDVQGLHYGLGYAVELGWIPHSNIFEVTDKTAKGVNDMITLQAFDLKSAPAKGQMMGIKISLGKNSEDIYVSFRASVAGRHRGVYITYQDKTSPNSRLLDAGCHTPSQQDAHLAKDMLFIDDSQTVVVSVKDVQKRFAKVQVWQAPGKADNIAKIRMRPGFTDGRTKCPATCQDSDLIISFTCAELKGKGYCNKDAKITVQGKKMQISTQICPQTCNKCKEVLESMPLEVGASACMDKAIKISGMDCPAIAKKDACGMKTTAGKFVGKDFCPMSCGKCPAAPPKIPPPGTPWQKDPNPKRQVGFLLEDVKEVGVLTAEQAEQADAEDATREEQLELSNVTVSAAAKVASEASDDCEDDPLWEDIDGHGCKVYARTIPVEGWGIKKTCFIHNGGEGSLHCRKTCQTCKGVNGKCVDNVCVQSWMDQYGICYACADFARMCTDPKHRNIFIKECPYTCGVCGDPDLDIGPLVFHYNGTVRNYADSVLYCESRNMVIASIRTEDEQEEAESLVKNGPAYVGATADGNGKWTWVDKSPWLYQNPKNDGLRGRSERYLAISRSGQWHDVNGEEKLGVLCRDKTPPCQDDDTKFCQELGPDYCTNRPFQTKCKRTCQLCWDSAPAKEECADAFDPFTCTRYKEYGWCDRADTKDQVRQNCRLTCGACMDGQDAGVLGKLGSLRHKLCDEHKKKQNIADDIAGNIANEALNAVKSSATGHGRALLSALYLALVVL